MLSAIICEIRLRREKIFVGDLGESQFRHGYILVDILGLSVVKPLAGTLSECGLEFSVKSAETHACGSGECFDVLEFHVVLDNEIPELIAVASNKREKEPRQILRTVQSLQIKKTARGVSSWKNPP